MAPLEDLNTLRVDQVGSLVVPPSVVDASERHLRGELSTSELRTIEDGAIREVIRKQEQVGLRIITDGEFRRRNFQDSFGNAVSGYDTPAMTGKDFRDPHAWRDPNNPGNRTEPNYDAAGPAIATRRAAVERLKLKKNVVLEEYKAAAAMTGRPVKVSLIGPDRIAQRFAWERSQAVYKDIDDFIADVVAIQRQMIRELVDAGCRYVHMDAPGFTAYVDKVSLDRMRARGEDPRRISTARSAPRTPSSRVFPGSHSDCMCVEAIHAASTRKARCRRSGIVRAAMTASPKSFSAGSSTNVCFWNMTASGRARSSRCALCERAPSRYWAW